MHLRQWALPARKSENVVACPRLSLLGRILLEHWLQSSLHPLAHLVEFKLINEQNVSNTILDVTC